MLYKVIASALVLPAVVSAAKDFKQDKIEALKAAKSALEQVKANQPIIEQAKVYKAQEAAAAFAQGNGFGALETKEQATKKQAEKAAFAKKEQEAFDVMAKKTIDLAGATTKLIADKIEMKKQHDASFIGQAEKVTQGVAQAVSRNPGIAIGAAATAAAGAGAVAMFSDEINGAIDDASDTVASFFENDAPAPAKKSKKSKAEKKAKKAKKAKKSKKTLRGAEFDY